MRTRWDYHRRRGSSDTVRTRCPICVCRLVSTAKQRCGDEDMHQAIHSAGYDHSPVMAEADRGDGVGMRGHEANEFACMQVVSLRARTKPTIPTLRRVPYPYSLVEPSGDNEIARRIISDTEHEVRMPYQALHFLRLQSASDAHWVLHLALTSATLHILTVLSSDALAMYWPSLDHAMSEMPSSWPFKVCTISPISGSHILIVLSAACLSSPRQRHA